MMLRRVICVWIFVLCALAIALIGVDNFLRKHSYRQGHDISQWLRILGQNSDDPLRIIKTQRFDKYGLVEFEVPLSYDLMSNYDFFHRKGRAVLIINDRAVLPYDGRSLNGNLLIGTGLDEFKIGMNKVQAQLSIYSMDMKDKPAITAYGPAIQFIVTNMPPSPALH